MIPSDWMPYRRADGELVGYLRPAGTDAAGDPLVLPLTLFGHPLSDEAGEVWWAEDLLEQRGLSYLADRWALVDEDGEERRVVIIECSPERLVVALAEFAHVVGRPAENFGKQWVLPVPTDRLRPA